MSNIFQPIRGYGSHICWRISLKNKSTVDLTFECLYPFIVANEKSNGFQQLEMDRPPKHMHLVENTEYFL